mgnify:CR=1 FL=1
MTRIIRTPELLGPVGDITPKPWGDDPDWWKLEMAWRNDYDNQPGPSTYFKNGYFREGDIVHASNGVGRIVSIFSEYSDYSGEFRPKYKVQYVTNKGEWSKVWQYEYIGLMQYAYAKAGDPLATAQINGEA